MQECKGAFEMHEKLEVQTSYVVMVGKLFIGNPLPITVSKDRKTAEYEVVEF